MTRETTTEAAQWRIGPTGPGEFSDWNRAHPVMVSVHAGPFHFQDHITATQARELGRALIECADEVESETEAELDRGEGHTFKSADEAVAWLTDGKDEVEPEASDD